MHTYTMTTTPAIKQGYSCIPSSSQLRHAALPDRGLHSLRVCGREPELLGQEWKVTGSRSVERGWLVGSGICACVCMSVVVCVCCGERIISQTGMLLMAHRRPLTELLHTGDIGHATGRRVKSVTHTPSLNRHRDG
jgi:hypothetical protein